MMFFWNFSLLFENMWFCILFERESPPPQPEEAKTATTTKMSSDNRHQQEKDANTTTNNNECNGSFHQRKSCHLPFLHSGRAAVSLLRVLLSWGRGLPFPKKGDRPRPLRATEQEENGSTTRMEEGETQHHPQEGEGRPHHPKWEKQHNLKA